MSLHEILYQGTLVVAGLLCLGVASYAWRHRDRRTAKLLAGVLLSVVFWTLMAGLVSVFSGTPIAKFATRFLLVGVVGSVLFLFLLSLRYTGREEYISRRSVALLLLEPVFITVASWAPQSRDLVYAFGAMDPGTFTGYSVTYGPLFIAHTAYSYVLLTASAAMLVNFAVKSEYLYQRQVAAILIAVFAPWVGNALFLFGPVSFDLTPVAFAVTGLSLWWAIFSQDFLELVPVARSVVVENIGAGVFVLDRDDRLVDINPKGLEMLDLEATDAIGMDATGLLAGMPAVRDQFEDIADVDDEVTGELSFGANHYQVRVRPLEDSSGTLIGRLFLVNDVTEQKRRQRELERQNDQLEQFANVVSHDLRNPLNVATAKLELGRLRDDDQELREAEEALDRIDVIIDDVLTLAREGKQVDDRSRVSLHSLANRAWGNVETVDAELVLGDDREFEADEQRLLRALENLFRNALDHGRGDVTVTVGATEDGFFVADDGPGIPADQHDEVFEDGFTTSESGTGFGLAIVRSIVEAHGWEIAVSDSEAGVPASSAERSSADSSSGHGPREDEVSGRSQEDHRSSSGGARFDVTDIPPLADDEPSGRGDGGSHSSPTEPSE
ncbi:hypothetical protein BV210_03490 [Halorientalis sp. IM1011]|uniref:histidine kinase N-terminal 7TM domain-containing protein n=1 Tax=Halorientalis sp. IM1011 TaxID=1932360 RepID=UPI00097CCD6B|nr:histidine kinase N-terminal 7TM domain-containing protein [Halorientalis sp. IM1011]AQL41834.1 hypothetical protein BV210_03490 [Halorientalis sp. IM1011]